MDVLVIAVLGAAAFTAVARPFFRHRNGTDPFAQEEPLTPAETAAALADLETEIGRYREAVRNGTLCSRCGRANPEGSLFCCECGRALQAAARPATPD